MQHLPLSPWFFLHCPAGFLVLCVCDSRHEACVIYSVVTSFRLPSPARPVRGTQLCVMMLATESTFIRTTTHHMLGWSFVGPKTVYAHVFANSPRDIHICRNTARGCRYGQLPLRVFRGLIRLNKMRATAKARAGRGLRRLAQHESKQSLAGLEPLVHGLPATQPRHFSE